MRLLFIGNSYTFRDSAPSGFPNDVPGLLRELAAGTGKCIVNTVVARGGETLEGHAFSQETLSVLDAGTWDIAIFQEQSTRPVVEPDKMSRPALELKKRLGDTDIILFLTWARKRVPEMQRDLNRSYRELGKVLNARIAPVGMVWERVIARNQQIDLFTPDGSHPSLLGTYLTACTFYALIFGETPLTLSNRIRHSDGVSYLIDREIAEFLKMQAWGGVQEYSSRTMDSLTDLPPILWTQGLSNRIGIGGEDDAHEEVSG